MKLPRIPPGPLIRRPGDVHTHRGTLALWRVHQTAGPHVTPWDELRYFGPTTSRFDPQRPPPALPSRGVTYAALDVPTVLAEAFQRTRVVDTTRRVPYLTGWRPEGPAAVGPDGDVADPQRRLACPDVRAEVRLSAVGRGHRRALAGPGRDVGCLDDDWPSHCRSFHARGRRVPAQAVVLAAIDHAGVGELAARCRGGHRIPDRLSWETRTAARAG